LVLGFFPDPYRDELFYSICARFNSRVQLPTFRATMRALFGTHFAAPVLELPNYLDTLVSRLPPCHKISADQLIDQHTILPFYAPFLSKEMHAEVRTAMRQGCRSTCLRRGVICERVRSSLSLRSCPDCDKAILENFGETYWIRLHQICGVVVCPLHRVFLVDRGISVSNQWSGNNFVPAKPPAPDENTQPIDSNNRDHQVYLRIAESAAWILSSGIAGTLREVQQTYAHLLKEKGLFDGQGSRWAELHALFCGSYSPSVLKTLQLDTTDSKVIPNLLWRTRPTAPAIHHLLFIDFLGLTASSFFRIVTAEPSTSMEETVRRLHLEDRPNRV
jgi:hypothetical protein